MVLTGVGAGLLVANKGKGIDFHDADIEADINPMRTSSLILLGTGAGMLVTGVVITGIMGYFYSKSSESNMSLHVSPNSLELGVVF